jgi:hypothetical protein
MKIPRSAVAGLPCLLATAAAGAQETDAPRDVPALHRLELRPYAGWAAVPDSVTGPFAGADVTFRLAPAVAIGIDAAAYGPFNRSPASPLHPLNEARDSFDLDATLFPWPARARGDTAAGTFEPYLLAGLGIIHTRPVSVVDPANRSFDYNALIDLALGMGIRVFVADRIAFTLELRDLLYFEKRENENVPSGSASDPMNAFSNPRNPATWYDANTHFTSCLELRLGASFFVGP